MQRALGARNLKKKRGKSRRLSSIFQHRRWGVRDLHNSGCKRLRQEEYRGGGIIFRFAQALRTMWHELSSHVCLIQVSHEYASSRMRHVRLLSQIKKKIPIYAWRGLSSRLMCVLFHKYMFVGVWHMCVFSLRVCTSCSISTHRLLASIIYAGWQWPVGRLKLQVMFRKRATHYGALWRKMTCKDQHASLAFLWRDRYLCRRWMRWVPLRMSVQSGGRAW